VAVAVELVVAVVTMAPLVEQFHLDITVDSALGVGAAQAEVRAVQLFLVLAQMEVKELLAQVL
jgi:hypothetical protein